MSSSKSFLIDTIMHEKQKLLLRQPPLLTSRESSPVSDHSTSRYIITSDDFRYTHSPGSSPRTPPTPHSMEHHMLERSRPSSLCNMRCPSVCTSCPPHSNQPICTLCEPREGEAAPPHQMYSYGREPCSRHTYSNERTSIYPINSMPSSSSRLQQLSPNFGK